MTENTTNAPTGQDSTAKICYIGNIVTLILAPISFLFLPIIYAIFFAMVFMARKDAPEWLATHYNYQIKIMTRLCVILGAIYATFTWGLSKQDVGILFSMLYLFGIIVIPLLLCGIIIAGVMWVKINLRGLKLLKQRLPIPSK